MREKDCRCEYEKHINVFMCYKNVIFRFKYSNYYLFIFSNQIRFNTSVIYFNDNLNEIVKTFFYYILIKVLIYFQYIAVGFYYCA